MTPTDKRSCGGCAGCGAQSRQACGRSGCCGGCSREIVISEPERDFLLLLAQIPFLPLARFIRKSAAPEGPDAVALAPVYINSAGDSMDAVQTTSLVLRALESKRLITLDYDKPLSNFDYSIYGESPLFKDFKAAGQDGNHRDGPPPGQSVLECGSIALTSLGQEALDSLE
ncbi:hypothetical protein SAMN02745823_00245 [Sporobacter termitidis DSM 10068]|uniref:Uncharacterized protein n=1 Tax=Sporobacter termitidis DSM 10068 TaxID=1123282 RepID=A0A1M5TVP0_9FIRM|nr:hypothetical protein [Sporobacter termitidis]SHH54700.1 hypothetical protein SAMN02745823_00245 [Sporobacter termitidis DSM 10068]